MKVYVQDSGWQGCIVVIESSLDRAKEIMKKQPNYNAKRPIDEYDLVEGFVYVCTGDM